MARNKVKFRKPNKVLFFDFRSGWGFYKQGDKYVLGFGDKEMLALVAQYDSLRELKLSMFHDRLCWLIPAANHPQ